MKQAIQLEIQWEQPAEAAAQTAVTSAVDKIEIAAIETAGSCVRRALPALTLLFQAGIMTAAVFSLVFIAAIIQG